MRDYHNVDIYLNELAKDIYTQPPDVGHTGWAEAALKWFSGLDAKNEIGTVLDIGCGQGFCKPLFANIGIGNWTGVTMGEDYKIATAQGLNVHNVDMTFLPFENRSYDMVFARHVLEHSPFPVLTLMEWGRVSKDWLLIVAPAPGYWGWGGKNHYGMMNQPQLEWLLRRSGWHIIAEDIMRQGGADFIKTNPEAVIANHHAPVEYRYLCRKGQMTPE